MTFVSKQEIESIENRISKTEQFKDAVEKQTMRKQVNGDKDKVMMMATKADRAHHEKMERLRIAKEKEHRQAEKERKKEEREHLKSITLKDIEEKIHIEEYLKEREQYRDREELNKTDLGEMKKSIFNIATLPQANEVKKKLFREKLESSAVLNDYVDNKVLLSNWRSMNDHCKALSIYITKYLEVENLNL
jgi:hypothetical protein